MPAVPSPNKHTAKPLQPRLARLRYALRFVFVSWCIWFLAQVAQSGSVAVAYDLKDRISDAWLDSVYSSRLVLACFQAVIVSFYKWALVIAPFVKDLSSLIESRVLPMIRALFQLFLPYAIGFALWLSPLVSQFSRWLFDWTIRLITFLPLESIAMLTSLCMVWSFCRLRAGMEFLYSGPIIWLLLRIGLSSDLVLKLIWLIIPAILSVLAFINSKNGSLSCPTMTTLVAYWGLFPPLVFLHFLMNPLLGGLIYAILTGLGGFWLFSGKSVFFLEISTRVLWQLCGRELWSFGGWVGSIISKKIPSWGLMINSWGGVKLTPSLAVGIFSVFLGFSVFYKIVNFVVWFWYLYETCQVAQGGMQTAERRTLAFQLMFLLFQYILNKAGMLLGVFGFIQVPIVFFIKVSAETLGDLAIDYLRSLASLY